MTTITITDNTAAPTRAGSPRALGLGNIIRSEWIKFRSVRSTRITLGATAAVLIGFGMIFSATAGSGDATGPAAFLTSPVDLALGAVTISAMIVGVLGVLVMAGEYTSGLIRTTVAAVGNRTAVLRAKAVVVGGLTATIMGAATVGALWLGQALYAGSADTVPLSELGDVVLGTTVYVTGIALIGLALGAILRSTASAIGVLVGGIFLVPGLLTLLPEGFTDATLKYLPSEAGSAIMGSMANNELLGAGWAYAVFAAWVFGLLTVAGVLMRRRDV